MTALGYSAKLPDWPTPHMVCGKGGHLTKKKVKARVRLARVKHVLYGARRPGKFTVPVYRRPTNTEMEQAKRTIALAALFSIHDEENGTTGWVSVACDPELVDEFLDGDISLQEDINELVTGMAEDLATAEVDRNLDQLGVPKRA